MSFLRNIGARLLSVPGRAWNLARRVVHLERAAESAAPADEPPPEPAEFEQPQAAGNPFFSEHELFDARVTAVNAAARTVTAVRSRATGINAFADDTEDTEPVTVGIPGGGVPQAGDVIRAWYAGRDESGDAVYHALGAADAIGKVVVVGEDGAGHVQVHALRLELSVVDGVWVTTETADVLPAFAMPQRESAFEVNDLVPLYRVGAEWAAAAPEAGLRVGDGAALIARVDRLDFGEDFDVTQTEPFVARVELGGVLNAVARIAVRVDEGADIGARRRLNFENVGSNVAVTVADDPIDEELDFHLIHDGRVKVGASSSYGYLSEKIAHEAPLSQAVIGGELLRVSIAPSSDTAPGVVQGGGPGFHVDPSTGVGSVNFGLASAQALEGSTASATPGTAGKVPLTGGGGKIDPDFVQDAGAAVAGKVSAGDQSFGGRKTFTPTGTKAGLNVGSVSADPSAPADGDVWHTSADGLHARVNGVTGKIAAVPPGDFVKGDLLIAAADADKTLSRLAVGSAGKVLGVFAGAPAWVDPPGAGEANTASNVGSAGTGVFDGKVGVDLQFRKLNAASSKITIALDGANQKIDFNVPDASTTAKGAVELATDGENAAGVAVQGNDSRLSNARTPTGAAGGDLAGSYPDPTVGNNAVSNAKLRDSGACSVIGRSANSGGDPADISAGSDGDVLRRASGALGFGAIPESSVTNLVSDLAGKVPTSRAINTTAPITGGGDLSADRTIAISDFVGSGASHARGAVPDPGASAGTTKFLREDATWAVPSADKGDRLASLLNTPVTQTGANSLTASDMHKLHVCTGSSGYTLTLPAASSNAHKFVAFRGAQNAGIIVTIDGNGSETINGYAALPLLTGNWLTLYCDGSNWHVADFGPGGDLVVAVVVASGAATVSFTGYLSRANAVYVLECCDVQPATDAVDLWLRFGSGGSYASGASDYGWVTRMRDDAGGTLAQQDNADSEITLSADNAGARMSNVSGEVGAWTILIYNPAGTTGHKLCTWTCGYIDSGSDAVIGDGMGVKWATAAVTDVRVLASSGNINGKFVLKERRVA